MSFIIAFGYFTALVGIFLSKLFPIWNHAIPGGLEDTRLFLWNAWWFHHAVSVLHTNPFQTMMLFHPFGTSLISHDCPLWMSLVTSIGQHQGLSMIAASNVWFALSWILAGFCTYGLAQEVTGEPLAGLLAGTYVMTHSYLLARAMQNWGQFNIYGIALFLWTLLRARRTNSSGASILAGIALAWTAACHFYFLIYSVLIWLAVAISDLSPYSVSINKRPSPPNDSIEGPWIRYWLLGLSITAGAVGLGISFHPGIIQLMGRSVSMRTPGNPLFVMWVLLMAWGASHFQIQLHSRLGPGPIEQSIRDWGLAPRSKLRHHFVLGTTAILFLSPLFWASFKLILAGGYPKQSILWKTHNSGANLLALFFPNPIHAIWGPAVSQWYAVRGMNAQEQAASIGWVCLGTIFLSRFWKPSPIGRQGLPQSPIAPQSRVVAGGTAPARGEARWLALALSATILSMGTHLHIAQYNLWCPLPFFGARLVPILGNVRIPERWMAVGSIAWGVVLAHAITKRKRWAFLVTALVLIENWPGIPFAATPPVFPVYERLRNEPPGAVLTVPLYIGDSSIGTGDALGGQFIFPWDHLWAQTQHEKPIVGGYIGRISRHIIDDYKADPFIHSLLDLEEHKIQAKEAEPGFGRYAMGNIGFRYVLVYPDATDPAALKYVLGSLPLEPVDVSGPVQLYRLTDYRSDSAL